MPKLMSVRKPTPAETAQAKGWSEWSKEVSSFPWSYSDKETCLILEGSARVKAADGAEIKFGPGDWVEFLPGLKCTWIVEKDIKKKYKFG